MSDYFISVTAVRRAKYKRKYGFPHSEIYRYYKSRFGDCWDHVQSVFGLLLELLVWYVYWCTLSPKPKIVKRTYTRAFYYTRFWSWCIRVLIVNLPVYLNHLCKVKKLVNFFFATTIIAMQHYARYTTFMLFPILRCCILLCLVRYHRIYLRTHCGSSIVI